MPAIALMQPPAAGDYAGDGRVRVIRRARGKQLPAQRLWQFNMRCHF